MPSDVKKRPTRTEAIKKFLKAKTHSDLAALYTPEMVVQVNVARDGGEKVDGESKGRTWAAWTDGTQIWKSFRIPLKSMTEPVSNDCPTSYDLAAHAEGIGMTGWNSVNRKSIWVGYDFDAIAGHAMGHRKTLSDTQLQTVQEAACAIPWVTVRKSTSGTGLHLYVFLAPVSTANHKEHAALATTILGRMSALVGFDFQTKVDAMGHVLWQWHRKMNGTDGLTLIKQGSILTDIPADWRDQMPAVSGKRHNNRAADAAPDGKAPSDDDRMFSELIGRDLDRDAEHARQALKHLGHMSEGYKDWLNVGMSLKSLGDIGLAIWDQWSQQSPKYEEGACAQKWATFLEGGGLGLGSLFHWAKENNGSRKS